MIKIYSVLNRCSHVNTENRVKLKRELNLFKKIASNKCFFDLLFIMASDGCQFFSLRVSVKVSFAGIRFP